MIKQTLLITFYVLVGVNLGMFFKPTEYVYQETVPTIITVPYKQEMTKVQCMGDYKLIDPKRIVYPVCDCEEDYDLGWDDGISQFSTECQVR